MSTIFAMFHNPGIPPSMASPVVGSYYAVMALKPCFLPVPSTERDTENLSLVPDLQCEADVKSCAAATTFIDLIPVVLLMAA